MLIGLDLSAAFETVDHSLLIERLQSQFGVTDIALDWLRSYLCDRSQYVKIGQHLSDTLRLNVGVPQGSVLGPLLFAVYCSPVADVIARQRLDYKLAVLTMSYKIRSTSTPSYLSRHIRPWESARHLRSSAAQLLYKPTTRTRFADRAFPPTVWNSLAVFKSKLKTHISQLSAGYCHFGRLVGW